MPKAEKIGWNKELNREVQLVETSKKSRVILKFQRKKIEKRTDIVNLPVCGSSLLH